MVTVLLLVRRVASAIPIWAWALAAVLAWGAFQRHSAITSERELATLQIEAAQVAKNELAQLAAKQQRAIRDANKTIQLEKLGSASATDALRRLRERAANSPCQASSAASGSASASHTGDLSTDVLGRVGEAAKQLAAIADERGRKGTVCEQIAEE